MLITRAKQKLRLAFHSNNCKLSKPLCGCLGAGYILGNNLMQWPVLTSLAVFSGFWLCLWIHLVAVFAFWLKRNDMADFAWGFGFCVVAAALTYQRSQQLHWAIYDWHLLSCFCFSFVGNARLALYLAKRTLLKSGEDARYRQWRVSWQMSAKNLWGIPVWLRSYLQVFLLQAVLLYLLTLPLLVAFSCQSFELGFFEWAAFLLWIFGFLVEFISDTQLSRFLTKHKGQKKILDSGLWAFSRHPNYFGQLVQHWALYFSICRLPGAWPSIFSPILMSFLILKVSGIPMLEALMQNRPGFKEYQSRTSIFFLWPPKK